MTKITGLSLQPAGSSRDPRDLELDVQQRVVSVTVFHKGKATKKLTGTLAIPDAQPLYIHHMLVPPAAEADEMQYTLTLKNAEIETGTFKKTKARHETLALTIFPTVQQYRTIADALCPLTGANRKCGTAETVGNIIRNMYQQVALDHFNNGDGSCRGNTFLSGVFVLEDDAEKSLYNRFMEAGSYRRPSTHEIPGCPRGQLVGSSCQAHGLELLGTNAVTVLSEPIVDAEQKQRAWAGAVEVRGSGRAKTVGDVHVDKESSVKTYSHAFFLPFTKDGKNFVFVKPETVGTLKGQKLQHLGRLLKKDGGGPSRQEGGTAKRFKKLRFFNAALEKLVNDRNLVQASHYWVSDVLAGVRAKDNLVNKDAILKTLNMELARDMGVADCKLAEQLVQRESNFVYRNGNEIFFTAAEAKDHWAKAENGVAPTAITISPMCQAGMPPPVQEEAEGQQ